MTASGKPEFSSWVREKLLFDVTTITLLRFAFDTFASPRAILHVLQFFSQLGGYIILIQCPMLRAHQLDCKHLLKVEGFFQMWISLCNRSAA